MENRPARSVTAWVTIDRPVTAVHAFLAEVRNWPRWAVVNILAVEPADDPGWWTVRTPDGPAELRLRADAGSGVVDHDFRFDGEVATVPARVVANGRGADFLMTVAQPSEVSDADFQALLDSVDIELATLKELLESGAEDAS